MNVGGVNLVVVRSLCDAPPQLSQKPNSALLAMHMLTSCAKYALLIRLLLRVVTAIILSNVAIVACTPHGTVLG